MRQVLDGSDSYGLDVAPASHWPDMETVIPVVAAVKKVVCSTVGMQATV